MKKTIYFAQHIETKQWGRIMGGEIVLSSLDEASVYPTKKDWFFSSMLSDYNIEEFNLIEKEVEL